MCNKIIQKNNLVLTNFPEKILNVFEVKRIPKSNQAFLLLSNKNTIGAIIFIEIFPEIEILDFAVVPSHQNKNFGSNLLEELILYAKEKKIKKVFLEVNHKNNKALHIYKKFDFHEVGIRKKYYNNQDNAILMEKIIS